jgi:hypothetical protein
MGGLGHRSVDIARKSARLPEYLAGHSGLARCQLSGTLSPPIVHRGLIFVRENVFEFLEGLVPKFEIGKAGPPPWSVNCLALVQQLLQKQRIARAHHRIGVSQKIGHHQFIRLPLLSNLYRSKYLAASSGHPFFEFVKDTLGITDIFVTSLNDYVQCGAPSSPRANDLQEMSQTDPEAQTVLAVRLHLRWEW